MSFSEVNVQLVTDEGKIWQNSSEYSVILKIIRSAMICKTRLPIEQRLKENEEVASAIARRINGDDSDDEEEISKESSSTTKGSKDDKDLVILKPIRPKNMRTVLGLLKKQEEEEEREGFLSSIF